MNGKKFKFASEERATEESKGCHRFLSARNGTAEKKIAGFNSETTSEGIRLVFQNEEDARANQGRKSKVEEKGPLRQSRVQEAAS